MDEGKFKAHLKRAGRSRSVVERALRFVKDYERYLSEHRGDVGLDKASKKDLEAFVDWFEKGAVKSAKLHLWAVRYYYDFASNPRMVKVAGTLREERLSKIRKVMPLSKFVGVRKADTDRLASLGIVDVEQMLEAGRTREGRRNLADRSGLKESLILEFVKLSDLARIPGVKDIRARLYHDAGVDTIEKMAKWNPAELREMLIDFVEKTRFDGMAPLPKEARCAVETARKLPRIVEY